MLATISSLYHLLEFHRSKKNRPNDPNEGLFLYFNGKGYHPDDIGLIMKTFSSQKPALDPPADFSFDKMDLEETIRVTRALNAGFVPKGVTLQFSTVHYTSEIIELISEALESGRAPEDLSLDICKINKIDENPNEWLPRLFNAISSGQCAKGLHLNLRGVRLNSQSVGSIVRALESGRCPKGFKLDLSNTSMNSNDSQLIFKAIASDKVPEGFSILFEDNELNDEVADEIFTALKSGKILSMELANNSLGDRTAEAMAQALESGYCPNGFSLDISNNAISEKGIARLFMALESGGCPRNFTFNLHSTHAFTEECSDALEQALRSGNCPKGLSLNFRFVSFQNTDMLASLADAIIFGRCPEDFSIEMKYIRSYDECIEYLTQALQSKNCPVGFRLQIEGSIKDKIKSMSILDLEHILENSSELMQIDHSQTTFKELGYIDTAYEAWAATPAPLPKITSINFSGMIIDDYSINRLMEALVTMGGISIDLSNIALSSRGFLAIVEAINRFPLPEDLTMILQGNPIVTIGIGDLFKGFMESQFLRVLNLKLDETARKRLIELTQEEVLKIAHDYAILEPEAPTLVEAFKNMVLNNRDSYYNLNKLEHLYALIHTMRKSAGNEWLRVSENDALVYAIYFREKLQSLRKNRAGDAEFETVYKRMQSDDKELGYPTTTRLWNSILQESSLYTQNNPRPVPTREVQTFLYGSGGNQYWSSNSAVSPQPNPYKPW